MPTIARMSPRCTAEARRGAGEGVSESGAVMCRLQMELLSAVPPHSGEGSRMPGEVLSLERLLHQVGDVEDRVGDRHMRRLERLDLALRRPRLARDDRARVAHALARR